MKFASYVHAGRPTYGLVRDDGVINLSRRLGFQTLRALLTAPEGLKAAAALVDEKPDAKLPDITLLPPIPDPDKIVCLGLNYKAHAAEANLTAQNPRIFIRMANTLVGHGSALVATKISEQFDYEGELAVIVGKAGRNIKAKDAMAHVAGYSCFNDGSVRDFQMQHSVSIGKNFYRTGGFGPYLVTADEVGDPAKLTLKTRVNGTEVQNASVADLITDIPAFIEYVTAFTEIVPGDVLVTGTPEGVGLFRKPPLWLKPGDTVEVDISKVGVLKNGVVADS
jgi:2-keto-4-pentenoate hydratase/2-oxohepta-3-ene-1,7-dioic acid hydratase in catechol pathway